MIGYGGRFDKPGELEAAMAVRRAHHGYLDVLIAKSSDTSRPFSFDCGSPFEIESQLPKESDRRFKVFDHDSDVVQPFERHVSNLQGGYYSDNDMKLPNTRSLALALLAIAASVQSVNAAPQPKRATPIDPITGIVAAFKSYSVVALSEGNHGNEQGHALRLALIRDPRFAAVANDIVVEFGNSRYQDVMDRFLRGDEVPYAELRKVWQDTTQTSTVWDTPIYEEFFRAVRAVNASRSAAHRLRVWLGDAPIDWERVHTAEDISNVGRSDGVPAGIVEREVIAKGRRALVIYGEGHLVRRNLYWNMKDRDAAQKRFSAPVDTIVTRLEQAGIKVYSISTTFSDTTRMPPEVASWPAPTLLRLAGTSLGLAPVTYFNTEIRYFHLPDGTWERVTPDGDRSPRLQDQFDAILYLGSESSITYSQLPRALCNDPDYVRMRLGRMQIASGPVSESDRVRLEECER